MRMRVGPRFVAVLGECLALMVASRFTSHPRHDLSVEVTVGRVLVVGLPLSFPWLIWLFMDRSSPHRVLTVFEILFYGVLMAYQLVLLVFLPKVMADSQGFAGVGLWAVSAIALMLVPLLAVHGRARAQRKSRGEGRRSS